MIHSRAIERSTPTTMKAGDQCLTYEEQRQHAPVLSNFKLYSCTPTVRKRARTTSSSDGSYVLVAIRSMSSKKLRTTDVRPSRTTRSRIFVHTHKLALSASRIRCRASISRTTPSSHSARISSRHPAITSVASSRSGPSLDPGPGDTAREPGPLPIDTLRAFSASFHERFDRKHRSRSALLRLRMVPPACAPAVYGSSNGVARIAPPSAAPASDDAAPSSRRSSFSTCRSGASLSRSSACLSVSARGGPGSPAKLGPVAESGESGGVFEVEELGSETGAAKGEVAVRGRPGGFAASSCARESRMRLMERTRLSWTTARQEARSATHACGANVNWKSEEGSVRHYMRHTMVGYVLLSVVDLPGTKRKVLVP